MPKYKHIQLVAYETPTFAVYPSTPALGTGRLAKVPDDAALTNDGKQRLRRFSRVLDEAHAQVMLKCGDQKDTLKVFVAPEFYFRPNSGTNNSYTVDEGSSVMHALRSLFQAAHWGDWLFVCGTVFWLEAHPRIGPVHWNTAVVVRGGGGATWSIDKGYISRIDGVLNRDGSVATDLGPDTNPHFRELFNNDSTRKLSIIETDEMRVGIEICLEHGNKYLRGIAEKIAAEDTAAHGVARPLDLHVLTACGMKHSPAATAATNGGLVFRVDGIHHPSSWAPHSQVFRVDNNRLKPGVPATVTELTGSPGSHPIALPDTLQSAYAHVNSVGAGQYPQQVHIHARQLLERK